MDPSSRMGPPLSKKWAMFSTVVTSTTEGHVIGGCGSTSTLTHLPILIRQARSTYEATRSHCQGFEWGGPVAVVPHPISPLQTTCSSEPRSVPAHPPMAPLTYWPSTKEVGFTSSSSFLPTTLMPRSICQDQT
ncbi:hypothetical protein FA13DRAFT_1728952 [Coprinellus micaceus]|uniref:Uncharacterized protein n=1 Tax=Coprinellus micaceus TaxID=71717 RepID=A0A4Y7TLU6_COPMI|nr:hypothetical protein FA13DRAFT_1728952 [Coprinellus micaceus]